MAREDIPGTMEEDSSMANVEMLPMSEEATPERSDGKPKSSPVASLSSSSGIGGGGLLGCHGMMLADVVEEETAPVEEKDSNVIL